MAKKVIAKAKVTLKKPRKSKDLPASVGLLNLSKQELKSDITTLRLESKVGFTKVDGQISALRAEISDVKSAVFQIKALVEEQNSLNRVALDGYAAVYEEEKSTQIRVSKLEKKIFGFE